MGMTFHTRLRVVTTRYYTVEPLSRHPLPSSNSIATCHAKSLLARVDFPLSPTHALAISEALVSKRVPSFLDLAFGRGSNQGNKIQRGEVRSCDFLNCLSPPYWC